jgi:hypothetical protein
MKKLLLLTLLLAGVIFSCTKENNPASKQRWIASAKHLPLGNGGKYNVLGWGYDVTGQYANGSSAIGPVINVAKFDSINPDRILLDSTTSQYVFDTYQANVSDLSTYLTTSVADSGKILGLFKGTVKASFSDSTAFSSRYVYGYFNVMVKESRIYFNTPESSLLNYLTPTFVQDIATQSPAYIVAHYGTHVLTDCTLGGKLEVMYRSETDNTSRTDAGALGISAGMNFWGVSGKISGTATGGTASRSKNFNQSYSYTTHGGDPAKGLTNTLTFGGATDTVVTLNIANWQNSCTKANAELIDIKPGTLIPIYNFVQDPTKAATLKSYVAQYLAANGINMLNDNYPTKTLYRFSNTSTGDHLLSNNVGEVSGQGQWTLDGTLGQIYSQSEPGLVPLYRYDLSGYHFCTTNRSEIPNQQPEEILGYVDLSKGLGEIPIYRFNAKSGKPAHGHIYATSQAEFYSLQSSNNWSYEGITGYISQ